MQAGAPLVAASLGDGHATALVADLLTVECPPARLDVLTDPAQQRLIGNTCLAVFGTRLRLVVRAKADKDGGVLAVTDERQRRYQAAQEHPAVRELMQRFEAELVGRELIDVQTWLARVAAEREATPRRRYAGDLNNGRSDSLWTHEPSPGLTGGDSSYD